MPRATLDDAARAVQTTQIGKRRMAALPAYERAAILIRTAELIEQQIKPLGELLAYENGKPIMQTRDEVRVAARIFRGFGEEAKQLFEGGMRETDYEKLYHGRKNLVQLKITPPQATRVYLNLSSSFPL